MSTVRYCIPLLGLVMLFGFASAQVPTAAFGGTPTIWTAPLTALFTDQSTGSPTGWAWYFGDENWSVPVWTRVNTSAGWTGRGLHSSVVLPNGGIVLMGGNTGSPSNNVWRSMDNGSTWTQLQDATWTARWAQSAVALPDGSIVLTGGWPYGYSNDTWRSTDNGTTWTQMNASSGWTPRGFHSCVAMPDGSIVLMGGTGNDGGKNDTWHSTDNGTTWTLMNASSGWTPRASHTSVVMPDGSIVLMGGTDSGWKNDTWRSTDNGATWKEMTASAGWSARYRQNTMAMPDGSLMLIGGDDGVTRNDTWRSTDNGATWTQLPNAAWTARRESSSVVMPDSSIVLAGGNDIVSGGGVHFMNDVWRLIPTGSSAQNPSHTYTTPGTFQVSLQTFNADGYNSTRKNGYITVSAPPAAPPGTVANFTGTPTSGTAPLTVSFTDLSTGNPTGRAWFFGDENYAEPWTQMTASAGWSGRRLHSSVVMPDGSIVLMGGSTGGNDVWRSMDNGVTWTQMTASAAWAARIHHSSVVMPDGSIVLMGGLGLSDLRDVWRSTDAGATWTQMTASAGWEGRYGHTSVAMPDGSIVLMGGAVGMYYRNDVWRSTDNGATWTLMNASAGWLARMGHSSVALADGSIVLMGGTIDAGSDKNDVWRSTDYGATWTQLNSSAGWSERIYHSSVGMPDGSIVLSGGSTLVSLRNDVWRSTDNGATWTLVNASAGWSARELFTSVAMPDGSIVLMGGATIAGDSNDVWRFAPAGSSAQNPSHRYTTPGFYQVSLQAYNTGGYNSTQKARYIRVDNEGTDSGGDIPPPIAPNPTTPSLGKTITETVNVGGGSAVSRAEVTGKNLGKNLVVTAFPRNNLPSGIALTQTTVYQYMSIVSGTIPGVVDHATLEFSVPQAWLTEHGFTAGDIVMMHYDNGQWQQLETRYVSQNSGNVFYRATTPGFSYFAIVYQKNGTEMGVVTHVATTVPTQEVVLKAPVQESLPPVEITREKTPAVPPAPVTQPPGGIPMTTIIVGTTGAIATIIGTVLIRHWWIRKQNPTLFRKNDRY